MEDSEGRDTRVEAVPGGADPAAVTLALSSASQEKADAYLEDTRRLNEDQRRMLHLQMEEMRAEEPYKLSHYRLRRFSGYAKAAFEFSVGLLALTLVTGFCIMLWSAAHDDGLVIEAFSVPPDLTARGLTGQVVAARMLDNLSAMQAQNNSSRAPGSFANNWGDDLKVEIPETGISIGELNRYLHRTLGRQTLITGEVVHDGASLTVTARAGAEAGKPISGPEADFNSLLQRASEAVYARTQPYRSGIRLLSLGRNDEAITVLAESARSGSQIDRAWAYAGLTNALGERGLVQQAFEAAKASVALKPDFAWGWFKVATWHRILGRPEAELEAARKELQLLDAGGQTDLRPEAVPKRKYEATIAIDNDLGDYADEHRVQLTNLPELASSADAAGKLQALLSHPGTNVGTASESITEFASNLIRAHDLAGARHVLAGAPAFAAAVRTAAQSQGDAHAQARADVAAQLFREAELLIAGENENWPQVLQIATALDAGNVALAASDSAVGGYPPTSLWPVMADAQARTGDFAAAHARIDKAPRDCDLCLRTRGRIDAAQKNWNGAAFWFAEAARQAPSIPFAYADWGRMLMDKGDLDGAIEKFTTATQKGPHFADAIELWGEALLLQKHPDLALAKFEEANTYAPNWGRLHLKWGEALAYTGKPADAKAQFARAAQLDLTANDKAELARQSPHA